MAISVLFDLWKAGGRCERHELKIPANLLDRLARAKIICGTRGRHGGMTLTARINEITVHDLAQIAEHQVSFTTTASEGFGLAVARLSSKIRLIDLFTED